MTVRRAGRRVRLACDRGAALIEFALVAPVLLVVIMGICDLVHTLYVSAQLQGVVQKAARDSTLEDFSTAEAQATLDANVTNQVQALASGASVTPERRYYKTYAAASAKTTEPWTDTDGDKTCDHGEPFTDNNSNGVWDKDGANSIGGAKDRTVYTVTVKYPRLFPIFRFIGMSDSVQLVARTILENQPYGDQTPDKAATQPGKCT